jgi:putative glutamine amidotransferase
MVRIAIPEPSSGDAEYNGRSLPPYLEALRAAGAEPVVVALHEPQARVAQLLAGVEGILLPGSRYDVDPERYGAERIPECGEADPGRTAVDELFLQDAFNLRKPVLAICHGAQTLNVWRNGTLVQDLKTAVNHRPGRDVIEAHPVRIAPGSRLAQVLSIDDSAAASAHQDVQVNSSHHQAILRPGDNLRVTAVSPGDGVVEAVELESPSHFVVAVQWHPERSYAQSCFSRGLFAAFVEAVEAWQAPAVESASQ